jgi:heptaprenyl diphosphate synthase
MALLLRFFPAFSLIGISIAGAVAHSLGQIFMAALIINQAAIFYYLPVMLLFSVSTGFITGLLLKNLVKSLKSSKLFDTFFYE